MLIEKGCLHPIDEATVTVAVYNDHALGPAFRARVRRMSAKLD